MAFNLGGGGKDGAMVSMNLVPLIDVMLVLLILFIVTIPIQTHAVKLDMPPPDRNSPQTPAQVVDLEIDFDGTVFWNGSIVPNRATLRSFFERVSVQPEQPEIHLRPNRLARYEIVAQVMADAQSNGVEKIGFVGTAEFAN
jgi:biopolymer transport protein ExbD